MLENPNPWNLSPLGSNHLPETNHIKNGKQRNEKLIYIKKSPSPGRFCFFPQTGRRFLFRRGGLDKKCHCRYFSKVQFRWNSKHIFLKNKRKYCLFIAEYKIRCFPLFIIRIFVQRQASPFLRSHWNIVLYQSSRCGVVIALSTRHYLDSSSLIRTISILSL